MTDPEPDLEAAAEGTPVTDPHHYDFANAEVPPDEPEPDA